MNVSKYDIMSETKISFRLHFNLNKDKKKNAEGCNGCELIVDDFCDCLESQFVSYPNAKILLVSALKYIKANGSTDASCSAEISFEFPHKLCPVYRMNVCKFILSFKEEPTYRVFPNRKNVVGAMSIKRALDVCDIPDGMTFYDRCCDKNILSNDMYGVDLSMIDSNVITVKYCGGKHYEDKFMEISALVDSYIANIYSIVSEPAYSIQEVNELREISERRKKFSNAFSDYNEFAKLFPNVTVLIDLWEIKGMESVYWSMIRDRVKDIMIQLQADAETRVTINYDTDCSMLQLKNCEIKNAACLCGVDMLDCKVSGVVSNCSMYTCDVNTAILNFCTCFSNCHIDDSYVSDTYLSDGSKCTNCKIYGDSTISGTYEHCKLADGVKYMKDTKFKHTDKNGAVEV